jgi:sulfur carrier protein ThiS
VCDTDERRKEILDSSGKVKPSVVVVLKRDFEDSKVVDSEYAELKDGDVVMVLRAVFGG